MNSRPLKHASNHVRPTSVRLSFFAAEANGDRVALKPRLGAADDDQSIRLTGSEQIRSSFERQVRPSCASVAEETTSSSAAKAVVGTT